MIFGRYKPHKATSDVMQKSIIR